MSVVPPEERFHTNVVALADLIQELINDANKRGFTDVNPLMVQLACKILASYDKIIVIENFIEYSHQNWDKVRLKEEVFFTEHAGEIFKDLPLNNVNAFKNLFTMRDSYGRDVIIKEDRDAIWEFFFSLVKTSIHYAHQIKKPTTAIKNGNTINVYRDTAKFQNLDIVKEAQKWGVKLNFNSS